MSRLVSLFVQQGKYAQAERIARQALETAQRAFDEKHGITRSAKGGLAWTLMRMGRLPEAERLASAGLAQARRLSLDDKNLAGWLDTLGHVLLGKGEGREAEPLFREAIELDKDEVFSAGFRRGLQSALGACLTLQGRYADAEPLLVSSYGFHELKGVSEPETHARESLRRIIDLYEAWDTAEPGKGYAEKAAEWQAKRAVFQS